METQHTTPLPVEANLIESQEIYKYDNGYGASVVLNRWSYGNKSGLFELAVLKGDSLCYDTPITNDVLGFLTREEVDRILTEIKKLPKTN